jgi:hypothetical protein
LSEYALFYRLGFDYERLLLLVHELMQALRFRAATARGGVKTLILSALSLLLWLLMLLLQPDLFSSTSWVLLLLCPLLGLIAGYAKLTEPFYVIELDAEGFSYVHHKGRWRIAWQSFSFVSVPQLSGKDMAYIGIKLTNYDSFLQQLQPRLAAHLLMEQRHLVIAALSRNCPSGTCPTELMVELGEFSTRTQQYTGVIAMFGRRMQLLKQLTDFELFIPVSAIGSNPADFCRKVNQTRLQCLNNTVT